MVVLLAVATGLVAMLLSVPQIAPVLIAGLGGLHPLAGVPDRHRAAIVAGTTTDAAAPSFAGGFLLAVANPKAYVAIAAVFAGTTLARTGRARHAG